MYFRAVILTCFSIAGFIQITANAAPKMLADFMELKHAFEQSALRLQDTDDHPTSPIKWDQKIFYAVRNAGALPSVERLAWSNVKRIAAIAGLDVEETTFSDPRANFLVFLTDNEAPTGSGLSGSRTCFTTISWSDSRITKVELTINFNNMRRISGCVAHEVMHGFGFIAHPHSAFSILSYVYNQKDFTTLDRYLIETLYDKRIFPGMPRHDAGVVACRILAEKLPLDALQAPRLCVTSSN